MKLAGMDGNIFFILGKASQLLKRSGQPEQAKEVILQPDASVQLRLLNDIVV